MAGRGGLSFAPDDVAFVIAPDQDRQHIDLPTARTAPVIANDVRRPWWEALVQALAGDVDAMVATFLENFTDPIEFLPWDGGEYVWIVPGWDLDDAITEVFGHINPEVREQLSRHLGDMSAEWILSKDIETFAE